MIKTLIVGNGYWGKIIQEKLFKVSNVISIQSSVNYDPRLFEKAEWIFVVTPVSSHYQIVKECLINGVNVFVEKPFTNTFEEAKELVSLARLNNKILYVDNVFLHRSELFNLGPLSFNKIKFFWHKFGPFKDSIINDLLYHDLYILISIKGVFSVKNLVIKVNQFNVVKFKFQYGSILVEMDYNRIGEQYYKSIFFDGKQIKFTSNDQDPLMDIILGCLNESHDFYYNQELNLETMKIFTELKEKIECNL
jgi:hypothetical protein